MRRFLTLCLAVATPAWAPSALLARQPAPGATIDALEIQGRVNVPEAYIRGVIRTAVGDPVDQAALDADVRRLLATGRFLTASAQVEQRDGRVVAVFWVGERIAVSAVRFRGNVKLKEKKLRELVPIAVGDPVDAFTAREGQDAIVAAYRDEGYGHVVVGFDADLLDRTGELVYEVEEGPRIRIRKIHFEGNASFDARELSKQIQSKTYLWIFRDGKLDLDQVEQDAVAVQSYYRGQGYLDAQASYRVDPDEKPDDVVLVFVVAEGSRYRVESVTLEGNTVFSDAELLGSARIREGGIMRQSALDRDERDIHTRYGSQGYIYAGVRAVWVYSQVEDLVQVTIRINEGDAYRVGRIVPRGNETTQDKVIRRALNLFPPDDLIDLTELRAAEQRLRETQIFGRATITARGEQPGVRDLVIDVEESQRAGDFIFGVGVNSNSGLVGSVVLDIKNFDLFDWPRSFTEFIKLRSFHGAGQRMRIEMQPGTELTRFRIDFVEPYFLDKPIRFGSSIYYFERGRDAYNERRVGGNVSFGKRLTSGRLNDWYVEGALRVEDVNVDDLDLFAPRDVRDVEGGNFLTSIKGTLARDRTDSRFVPTTGDVFRLTWEQFGVLGGEHFFAKVNASYTKHWTVMTDQEERKHVFSIRGDVGGLFGDSPTFERYYAGGIGSIRGFEFRGISPRQGLDDDSVGGDFLLLAKAEYSFPLYGDNLRGVFFTDMGTVEEGFELTSWRMSIGFGVRLQIDFFGPVPLEFDLAVPILKDGDDEEQVFSFFIGATF